MWLTGMRLTNYRCFSDTQNIDLKPITLVLGKNNSGKSALVRAPLVWSTGLRPDSAAPLDLDVLRDLKIADSFTDLIQGGIGHRSIGAEFRLSEGRGDHEYTLAANVQNFTEFRSQIITKLNYRSPAFSASFEWLVNSLPEDSRYDFNVGGQQFKDRRVSFRGLTPILRPSRSSASETDEQTDGISRASLRQLEELAYLFPRVRYLGPFRHQPNWSYPFPQRAPRDVGTSGLEAFKILARDKLDTKGAVLEWVNRELVAVLPDWQIDTTEIGTSFSVSLLSTDNPSVRVNIADAGAGVAQVLPLFVQRALDALEPTRRPVLEIVEQPELHLHPAAHAAVADLYATAIKRGSTRFLIETHSETFLLRLRRRIAEGVLAADDVAVYFVDREGKSAQVRQIHIDERGNLDYWPAGVFSEDYDELRELAAAQEAR
jgi:AAA ATPase domain/Protein of unknown function (DUF3696)